jgi:hypothetical protein
VIRDSKKHHQKHFVKRGLARAKIYTFGEFSVKVILQAANCIYPIQPHPTEFLPGVSARTF